MLPVENIETRILIVDDEPSVRELLVQCLGDSYECVEAESAESALAKIQEQTFAAVITDVCLPGMSGLEMVEYVSVRSTELVFLVISGQSTIDSAVKAMRAGAFDYILKPFDLMHLSNTVRRAVEHYRLRVIKRRYEQQLEQLVAQRTAELEYALKEVEQSHHALENSYSTTVKALVQAFETRVFETYGHSERVVTYSLRLGHELGLDKDQMRCLELGALLHDVGKIGVPDEVLRKPSNFNDEEWRKMRLHTLHGEQILRDIPFLEGATKVVAQHHERWDGSGYPQGLKGEEIDLNARIFALVDAYDSITSDLIYRDGKSHADAVAEIEKCSGTQFDPRVVAAFHLVPREHWESLFRHSWIRKADKFSFGAIVADVINGKVAF